jgi:hypothetical protein
VIYLGCRTQAGVCISMIASTASSWRREMHFGCTGPSAFVAAQNAPAPSPPLYFKQPFLPYQYSALEPFIDTKTMVLHWTKHVATYYSDLNGAAAKDPSLQVYKPCFCNPTRV